MIIHERPTLTDVLPDLEEFIPEPDSVYIFAASGEERSAHSPAWEAKTSDVIFVPVTAQTSVSFASTVSGEEVVTYLRSGAQLGQFWRAINRKKIYLDVTGLDHKVWPPLVRSALALDGGIHRTTRLSI